MLDIKWIRENEAAFTEGLRAKGISFNTSELLELDEKRRSTVQEAQVLKTKRNEVNEEITRLKKEKKPAEDVIASMKETSQKIKDIDMRVGDIDRNIAKIMLAIPNLPHKSVPVAKGAEGNLEVRKWGEPKEKGPKSLDHLELAIKKGWLSMDEGAKISGAGFPVYKAGGAKLQRALINFMLDTHTTKHGYTEVWPPTLVNRASMTGTGQLPKMENDMYHLDEEDLFLIPTGEVPLTNLMRDVTLREKDLPINYTAYTPCFRREAGSYGKDTRGLSRVHEFDKVEMVKFVKPEDSLEELEVLTSHAEAILQALELPYRVVLLGSGDMSFAAAKCYDLEVWAPVSEKWFEVSSCSTFGDFQARRMNAKFKRDSTGKSEFLHTLNGSGLALARIVLCLLENFQTEKGDIEFPKALQPYLGNEVSQIKH